MVDHSQLHPVGVRAGAQRDRRAGPVAQRVVHHVRHRPFQQSRVGEDVGEFLVDLHPNPVGLGDPVQRPHRDLLVADRSEERVHGAGGEPRGVQQILHQAGQPVHRLLDGGQQLGPVGPGQPQHRVAQAPGGGLDRGQWAAQVVPDGGEQRAAGLVRLGPVLRGLSLGGRALAPQGEQGLPSDGLQQPSVGRRQRSPGTDGRGSESADLRPSGQDARGAWS